jgi:hypothetical protein
MRDNQVFLDCQLRSIGYVGPTLMYIKLSMLVPRSSGTWARHLARKPPMSSPFLHLRVSVHPHLITHINDLAMPTAVPVRVRDLDNLVLDLLLACEPPLAQLLAFCALLRLPFPVGEERRVDVGILRELLLRSRRVWRESR